MEITTDDATDKDKDMKSSFEAYADDKDTKKEKKEAPKKAIASIEELFNSDKPKEKDEEAPKSSILEILGAAPEDVEKEPDTSETEEAQEAKEATEAEPPIEQISEDETTEVAQEYIDTIKTDVNQELAEAEPDSVEEAEATASQVFLEELQNKVDSNEEINEAVVEDAGNQALETLDIEPETVQEVESSAPEIEESKPVELEPEAETGAEEQLDTEPEAESEPQAEDIEPTEAETEPEVEEEEPDAEDDDSQTTPAMTSVPTPPTPQVAPPPVPPAGPPLPPIGSPFAAGPNLNALPTLNVNALNPDVVDRRRDAKNLMAGALVGYMIGRRRGRIKTEERLLPVQQKLEKQVSDLQQTISNQELKVRKLAALQFEQNRARSLRQLEQMNEAREKQLSSSETQEAVSGSPGETRYDQEQVERVEVRPESVEKKLTTKSIETMTLPLLLEVAETIVIGEVSLRAMYERGQISQEELKSMVGDYLSGENIEHSMEQVIAGQETLREQSLEKENDGGFSTYGDGKEESSYEQQLTPQENDSSTVSAVDALGTSVVHSVLDDQLPAEDKPNKKPVILFVVLAGVAAAILVILVAT